MGQAISNFTTTSQVTAATTVASFVENSRFPDRVCYQCSGSPQYLNSTKSDWSPLSTFNHEETDFPESASRLLQNLVCPYTTIHHGCSLKMPMILGSWSERLQRWFDYGEVFGGEDRDIEISPIYHLHRFGSDYLIFVDDHGVGSLSSQDHFDSSGHSLHDTKLHTERCRYGVNTASEHISRYGTYGTTRHHRALARGRGVSPPAERCRYEEQARKEILHATIFLLSKGYRILRLNIRSPLDDYQAKILLNCLMSQNQHLVCYPEVDYHWLLNTTI